MVTGPSESAELAYATGGDRGFTRDATDSDTCSVPRKVLDAAFRVRSTYRAVESFFLFPESFDQNVESLAGLTPTVGPSPFRGALGLKTHQALPSRLSKLTDNTEATALKN